LDIGAQMQDTPVFPEKPNANLAILGVITLAAFIAYALGVASGLLVFTPLLFYFPIILAAYWFPRHGVIFAVAVGILEVFSVYLFSYPGLTEIAFAVTTASFYVLVAVAVVISSLSREMHEREARYKVIFNSSDAGIFVLQNGACELAIEEVNPKGGVILQSHPRDLKGKKFTQFWQDEAAMKSFLQNLDKEGTAPQYETSLARPDGTMVPVMVSGARLPGRMVVLNVIDISTRIAHEKELREKNDQLALLNRVTTDASGAREIGAMMRSVLATMKQYMAEWDLCGASVFREGQPPTLFVEGDAELLDAAGSPDSGVAREWRDAMAGARPFQWGRGHEVREGVPRAGMAIPLVSGDATVGVLFLLSRRTVAHPPDQVVQSLASEIATAVTRINLMERLAEANRQANLYLDILMHDINNANLASLWYGDLLLEMLEGEPRDIARKMIDGIRKSREIIRNVETIRKVHGKKADLKPVDLDAVIRKEIQMYPDTPIEYSGLPVLVLADELLGEVFSNLVGNSIKFGGAGVRVRISVERPAPGEVKVTVSDTGPGIPDELKNIIFNRFTWAEPGEHGKGLGLYIVKMLLTRYGGDIAVSDRVPGDHAQGVSFQITLREVAGQ